MFLDFFYALRKHGLDVSVGEWMTLMEGMEKGLHRSSFSGSRRNPEPFPFGTTVPDGQPRFRFTSV